MGSSQESVALDRKLKEKELAALQARDEELDGLFERIYEDIITAPEQSSFPISFRCPRLQCP